MGLRLHMSYSEPSPGIEGEVSGGGVGSPKQILGPFGQRRRTWMPGRWPATGVPWGMAVFQPHQLLRLPSKKAFTLCELGNRENTSKPPPVAGLGNLPAREVG